MSDGVPLKQVLEPGVYRVEWILPTHVGDRVTLQGDLELQPDRPPRGNAYGEGLATYERDGDGAQHADFPQRYEAVAVTGQLLNGQYVVLIDAVIEVWFAERVLLTARAALIGRSPIRPENLDIVKLEVQVEGIDAVSGVAPIKKVKIPFERNDEQRYLDWTWEAVGNPESTQVWSDEGARVELQFYSSVTSPEGFFFRVSFSPVVLVTFSQPTDFNKAFSLWAEPLRRIVALSTGRKERITYLSVGVRAGEKKDRVLDFQVYGTALHQEPYSSRGNDIGKVDRAFSISPNDMSLLALIRRWQGLIDEHHPLLETYASLMFAPDQHPRSRFLLLIQAIEGLYGSETRHEFSQRVATHSDRRSVAISEAKEYLSSTTFRFLHKYLMKRPPSSLDAAISNVLAGVPIDVSSTLGKTDLIREAMGDSRAPKHVAEALRLVRNDLAHGTRGYDVQKLHQVVEVLDRVVRAHLLRILGCSADAQRRAQERRR